MSHFIIEQGKEVGREVAVPASGIKFGRSPANDLVLEDDVLMLFQGRFFFKSDGTLWVTDFSADVKSHIGGEPIDERQLKVGDLVEVSSTAFRVISTRQDQDETAPAPAAAEAIDLGFKPAAKKESHSGKGSSRRSSPVYRILQVLAVVLILLVAGIGATEIMRSKKQSHGSGPQMQGVFFTYESVQGGPDNIFRYALSLTPEGMATISVDDVRSRHFTRSVKVSPQDVAALQRELKDSSFFGLSGNREGSVENIYKLCDIAIGSNGRFNHVRILNREVPPEMSRLVSVLEDFAFNSLNVSRTLLKDDAALVQYAEEAYQLGADRYKNRNTAYDNLALAIKHLRESINYLETLEPKPEPFARATELLSRAREEQTARYKELMFDVDKAERSGDLEEARRKLRIAAQVISDRSDDRYETITTKQLQVEAMLR